MVLIYVARWPARFFRLREGQLQDTTLRAQGGFAAGLTVPGLARTECCVEPACWKAAYVRVRRGRCAPDTVLRTLVGDAAREGKGRIGWRCSTGCSNTCCSVR